MRKYWKLLQCEMRTILLEKEPMNVFMLVYPLMLLAICAYVLPAILDAVDAGENGSTITLLIGFALILASARLP
ncbi:MAG: hypothetical protein MZU79_05755 [Anaerotruncus sp.]|nr:hypothetical protein [Anaerotruncus sp.]